MRRLLWLAVAACGRIHFDEVGDALGDGGASMCNSVTRFADDFADGVQDPRWGGSYAGAGTSTVETGGELVISLAANATEYAAYQTTRLYDLRGVRMSVAVTQVPALAATVRFAAAYDGNSSVGLTLKDGMLAATRSTATAYDILAMMPYDAAAHRYWAIEEHAGRVAYETSPDGAAYATFADIDAPFDLALLRPGLTSGTDTAIAAPGATHFAAYDRGTPAAIDACPVATLVDRFDGTVSDHLWQGSYTDPCCTQTIGGGTLTFATDGAVGFVGKHSSAGYDLRNGALTATLVTPPASPMFHVSLNAARDGMNQLDLMIRDGNVLALVIVGGSGSPVTTPLMTGERYLRIREDTGTVTFEISADKQSWRVLLQAPDPFPVDDMVIGIDGGANAAGAPDSAVFDDFDVP